ncbi:MAB_1171c family putative transporter [Amycolatopsis sp. NPDC058986]|uniref:MAB_1171c family putative transporter n=1 Tax=unclassified Amycolatopsis TaxID=2618356 RepID=UPI00366F4A61
MIETLAYYCCVLGFAGFSFKLVEARRTQPARRMWCLSGFGICIAAGILVLTPAMESVVAGREPFASLVNLASDLFKIGAMAFAVAFARSMRLGVHARPGWHVLLTCVVIAGEVVLFFLARTHRAGEDTVAGPGRLWYLVAYLMLFIVYGVVSLSTFIVVFGRFARLAEPGPLRTGLWLIVGGAVSALAWTFWGIDDIGRLIATGKVNASEDVYSAILAAGCVGFAVAGATLSVWGPSLSAPLRWLRAYHAYRRIEPLWAALRDAVPGIALDSGRGLPGGVEFALYRRVIEIRDGHLALRPYFDPGIPALAEARARREGLPERLIAATVEAAALAAALLANEADRRYQTEDTPARQSPEADVAAEAAWLVQVTHAWRHSGVVEQIRRKTCADLGLPV